MIEARGLVVRRGSKLALDGVDLTVNPGQIVGVVGPNGAGKSTLIGALYRALPAAGLITYGGRALRDFTRKEIAATVAVLAQDRGDPMPITVLDAVLLGRLPHQSLHQYGAEDDLDRVHQALKQVQLTGFEDRLLGQLSGGERQRVSIARAIAQDAQYWLLDEPTNHLDIHHQLGLLSLVRELAKTTVLVLHDLNLAARVCDSLILLDDGHLVCFGSPAEVLTAELIGSVYRVSVTQHLIDDQPVLIFDL